MQGQKVCNMDFLLWCYQFCLACSCLNGMMQPRHRGNKQSPSSEYKAERRPNKCSLNLRREEGSVNRAHINGMIAACGDNHLLPCWRLVQILCVLCCPVQQRQVASAIGVVLLCSIHLHPTAVLVCAKTCGSFYAATCSGFPVSTTFANIAGQSSSFKVCSRCGVVSLRHL